jgi:hypothetical protein
MLLLGPLRCGTQASSLTSKPDTCHQNPAGILDLCRALPHESSSLGTMDKSLPFLICK